MTGVQTCALPIFIDSQGNTAIAGGGLWPEPDAFSAGVARRSFYWARSGQSLGYSEEYNASTVDDYHTADWYVQGKASTPGRCAWSDAYEDPVSKILMTTCTVPYSRDGRFAGVATIDLTLTGLADFLKSNGQVTGGYAFAIDPSGKVLYFPATGEQPAPADETALLAAYPWFKAVTQWRSSGQREAQTFQVDHDAQLGGAGYISLTRVPASGWTVGLATPQAHMTGIASKLTIDILTTLLPILALVFGLAWLAGRAVFSQINETTAQIDKLGEQGGGATDFEVVDG